VSEQRPKRRRWCDTPSSLLAVLQAARRAGDRELERQVTAELREAHGIAVELDPTRWPVGEAVEVSSVPA
jgi:hypothetical protein